MTEERTGSNIAETSQEGYDTKPNTETSQGAHNSSHERATVPGEKLAENTEQLQSPERGTTQATCGNKGDNTRHNESPPSSAQSVHSRTQPQRLDQKEKQRTPKT